MRRHSRIFGRASALFFLLLFAACAPKTNPAADDSAGFRYEPLRANAAKPKELARINSLLIATIDGPHAVELNDLVRNLSRSELTFESKIPKTAVNCSHTVREGADGCLQVEVTNYTERNGSDLGINEGAAVAFTVHVKKPESADDVWSAHFTFNETPLSQNVFQFGANVNEKGGSAAFTTARALFENGLRDALRQLNDERTKQFLK